MNKIVISEVTFDHVGGTSLFVANATHWEDLSPETLKSGLDAKEILHFKIIDEPTAIALGIRNTHSPSMSDLLLTDHAEDDEDVVKTLEFLRK